MKRILVLGILFGLIFTGLSFGQGQPLIFQLFNNSWKALIAEKIGALDDPPIDLVMIWARDLNNRAGTIEIVVLLHRDKKEFRVVYGWIQHYSDDEQGFFLDEQGKFILLDKKKDAGWELEAKADYDQMGNPTLYFYLEKKGDPESPKLVRTINIKEFVEENFKDKESPPSE